MVGYDELLVFLDFHHLVQRAKDPCQVVVFDDPDRPSNVLALNHLSNVLESQTVVVEIGRIHLDSNAGE